MQRLRELSGQVLAVLMRLQLNIQSTNKTGSHTCPPECAACRNNLDLEVTVLGPYLALHLFNQGRAVVELES